MAGGDKIRMRLPTGSEMLTSRQPYILENMPKQRNGKPVFAAYYLVPYSSLPLTARYASRMISISSLV